MPSRSAPQVTFLIVDDHPFFREGLTHWIERQPGWKCCGFAETVAAAREKLIEYKPQVVLLDLRLKDEDGLTLLDELPPEARDAVFIVLTQSDEVLHAERALRAGARGFVMKEEASDCVLLAVRVVLQNEIYMSPRLAAHLQRRRLTRGDAEHDGDPWQSLTTRELQVLKLLGSGQNVKEIAETLSISPKTVEAHRDNLRRKLKFPDAISLVRNATIWKHEGRI
jgi:DNA-binding NarL/FixJ family response regulator